MIKRAVITLSFIGIVLGYGISLNADDYVYTPNGTAVSVMEIGWELSPGEISYLDSYYTSQYPSATLLRSSSRKYNCHSYCWYSQSSSNDKWMNDPSAYWQDGSYQECWLYLPYINSKVYSPIYPEINSKVYYPYGDHSAIVYSSTRFNSKWGMGPLMRHAPSYCPYNFYNLQYYCR